MKNKWIALWTFIVVTVFFIPLTVLGATLHVGPGQTYNGTTQATINQAINAAKSGDIVYLHAATYNITAPIILKSGITLRGDGNSTIIHAAGDNVCNSESDMGCGYVIGNNVSGVTVCNLRFTSTARQKNDGGHGNGRNCIFFKNASNCSVYNVYFTRWLWNDAVRVGSSSGITVRDCEINAAHDGVCLYASSNCRVYNNNISVQINNGVRTDGSTNIEIDHNTFSSAPELGGWCCIQVQNAAKNINIHHNIFRDTAGKIGIAPYSFTGSNVSVHDNVFWNCAKPIEVGTNSNNIIDPSDKSVSNWVAKGYGKGSSGNSYIPSSSPSPSPSPSPSSSVNLIPKVNTNTNNSGLFNFISPSPSSGKSFSDLLGVFKSNNSFNDVFGSSLFSNSFNNKLGGAGTQNSVTNIFSSPALVNNSSVGNNKNSGNNLSLGNSISDIFGGSGFYPNLGTTPFLSSKINNSALPVQQTSNNYKLFNIPTGRFAR